MRVHSTDQVNVLPLISFCAIEIVDVVVAVVVDADC